MVAAQRLEPIYNELRELVKDSYYVMADETPHPVLESDRPGALHRGYMWNFYLPRFHTPFFEYHKGRGSSGIDTLLAGQVRVVQSDGFAVYDSSTRYPESCICAAGRTSGATLWKRKEMTSQSKACTWTNRRTVCRGENQNGTSGRGGGGKASPGKIVPYYQRTGKMVQGGIWTYGR